MRSFCSVNEGCGVWVVKGCAEGGRPREGGPLPAPVLTRTEGMPVTSYTLWDVDLDRVVMILPQVHLRKPCYDFTFL